MSEARFDANQSAGHLTLVFQGRLDSAGSAVLQESLLEQVNQVAPGQVLRFDLGAVEFVASAFLRLCIQSAKQLGNDRFELTGLTPAVREVFEIAGLDRHLRIVEPGAS